MKKCPKCGRTFEETNTLCPSDGTVLVKTKDALVGRTLADKYHVDEKISEGGMGAVYRGTHVLMEKAVAIKVLHPSLAADDKIVARFTREARAASRISHPHALNVTDFGEAEDGIVFLVMEYLRGSTLKQIVRAGGPMPLDRVITITSQIAGALDAAHAEGVVHRDLKSDNIMLCETGGTGGDWAKVLDFGIAKIKEPIGGDDPELTAPNLIIGTPQYMSPEQCSQASDIDFRSDIYSLGVIVFEMLAGHVPFTGESATTVMLKHLQEPAPSVLEERDDLPAAVGRVVARALAKRPEDRQQSAGELAEQLALAAEGAPSAAGAATDEVRAGVQETNRIVVSTGSHEGRETASEEYDEATVVRASAGRTPTAEHEFFEDVIAPPPSASLNPWKIVLPSAALLVALLGVFYAVSRNSQPAADNGNTPFAVDPNAVPVQTASPPTGAGESGVVPASTTAPSPGATVETPAGGALPPQPAPSSDPNATPALVEEIRGNRNANNRRQEGEGEEEEGEDPPPSPTPKPTQQRSSPTPAPSQQGEDPPPPTPRRSPPAAGQAQPAPPETPSSDPPPPSSEPPAATRR
ncbi:MAG TPA: protein kinase [Pyrinomonadaceae bacterium]|nr:protein kinase [Pyrinomonadaceae bacterium]